MQNFSKFLGHYGDYYLSKKFKHIILHVTNHCNFRCSHCFVDFSTQKKDLKLKATFSAYKNKTYVGKIESVASRIDAQTRSILARAKINNENSEILPGSLLEIEIFYNEKNALGVPDTSIMYEGSKKFIYKIIENNIIKKIEIETGIRNKGNLEVLSGINEGDKVIAEGLTKVRPGMKIKPIIKSK